MLYESEDCVIENYDDDTTPHASEYDIDTIYNVISE